MTKTFLTHDDIFSHSKNIISKLEKEGIDPDRTLILAVARGGLIPAGYLSYGLGCRNVETVKARTYDQDVPIEKQDQAFEISIKKFHEFDNIIICDDIYDSGNTFKNINELIAPFTTHCNIYNCALVTQDTEVDNLMYSVDGEGKWIVFPWDELEETKLG